MREIRNYAKKQAHPDSVPKERSRRTRSRLAHEIDEIEFGGWHRRLREQPVHLASVVRLMIEEVPKHDAEWSAEPFASGVEVIERLVEASRVDTLNDTDQPIVFGDPRDLKRREVAVENLVQCEFLRSALDAAEPDPVADHEVIE